MMQIKRSLYIIHCLQLANAFILKRMAMLHFVISLISACFLRLDSCPAGSQHLLVLFIETLNFCSYARLIFLLPGSYSDI